MGKNNTTEKVPLKVTKKDWVSTPQLSDLIGVTRDAISQARKTGRLVKGRSWEKRGKVYKYHPVLALKDWNDNVNPNMVNATLATLPEGTEAESAGGTSELEIFPETLTGLKLAEGKLNLSKKRIELDLLRGTVVNRDLVYTQLFDFGQRMRRLLQAVPHRVVDDVLAADSRSDALKILADEIDATLQELSNTQDLDI